MSYRKTFAVCKSPTTTYEVNRLPDVAQKGYYICTIAKQAERLKGPQHAVKGLQGRRHLGPQTRTKYSMVLFTNLSEIHISSRVGVIELVTRPSYDKSSVCKKVGGDGSLQQAGHDYLPNLYALQNQWNLGLTKVRKNYVNGDLVVVRSYSNEGGQFNIRKSDSAGESTQNTSFSDSSAGISMYIGKYTGLFQPVVYKIAYEEIKAKRGYTTPGFDNETLDGINLEWINKTIASMKDRSFQFKPVLRKYIPKPNGKLRPLGIPTPKDKVVQQAMRILIEPLFEPHFLPCSYGFRPNRGAHDALKTIRQWTGVTWAIEGDIKGCFDNINTSKLASLLETRVKDKNLMNLYWKAVKADYINNGHVEPHSLTGVPQGGVLSPFLSNVFMHELDTYVSQNIIPAYNTRSNVKGRCQNPAYTVALKNLNRARLTRDGKAIRQAERARMAIPSVLRTSTKVYYVRYADDWIIAIKGEKAMAEAIKQQIKNYLKQELDLELSENKTRVTHLPTEKAKFLGTYVRCFSRRRSESRFVRTGSKLQRTSNNRIILEAPVNLLIERLTSQGFYLPEKRRPKAITKWIYMKPEEILIRYNAILRGYINYYSFVNNKRMLQRIVWILRFSCVFTLCRKWNLSPRKVWNKLGANLTIKSNNRAVSFYVPDLTPTPLSFTMIGQSRPNDPSKLKYFSTRSTFTLDRPCVLCGNGPAEMHHVRHIKHIKAKGLGRIMTTLNRRQIPLCRPCHLLVHNGEYNGASLKKFS